MVIRFFPILLFSLLLLLFSKEAGSIIARPTVSTQYDSLARREADSLFKLRKWYSVNFSGSKPPIGHWEGTFLSPDPSSVGAISLDIHPGDSSGIIAGKLRLHYEHFEILDYSFDELRTRDSIRALKKTDLFMQYIDRKRVKDSIFAARYDESYEVSGTIRGDSIFFVCDTIYSHKEKRTEGARHFRFRGKCRDYSDRATPRKTNYFILGEYFDSASRYLPALGPFILNKER